MNNKWDKIIAKVLLAVLAVHVVALVVAMDYMAVKGFLVQYG